MGANGRRIREDKEQPAEHAERRRKRNSCQGGHSVSVSIRGQLPKKWLTAHSGGDGSRHARRPVQERAAPTAFQRTSLLMKCNTPRRDCESFFADVIKLLERRARAGRTRRARGNQALFRKRGKQHPPAVRPSSLFTSFCMVPIINHAKHPK